MSSLVIPLTDTGHGLGCVCVCVWQTASHLPRKGEGELPSGGGRQRRPRGEKGRDSPTRCTSPCGMVWSILVCTSAPICPPPCCALSLACPTPPHPVNGGRVCQLRHRTTSAASMSGDGWAKKAAARSGNGGAVKRWQGPTIAPNNIGGTRLPLMTIGAPESAARVECMH